MRRLWLSILTLLVLSIVACGDDSEQADDAAATPSTEAAESPPPKPKSGTFAAMIPCAESAGYNVDRRDRTLVVITGDAGQGAVNVERMPSHAKAAAAAKAADLIESKVVGRLWLKYLTTDETLRNDVDSCALTGTPN